MAANGAIDTEDTEQPERHEAIQARAAHPIELPRREEEAVQPIVQVAIGLPGSFTRMRRSAFRIPRPEGGFTIMPAPNRRRMLPRRRPASEMALDDSMGAADARNVRHASEDVAIVAGNADEPRDAGPDGNAQMALVPASQAEDDAMILATQNGSAVPVYEDAAAGFAFQDLTRAATGAAALPDPLENLLQQIHDCRDMAGLRALIHPQGLFAGLRNADGTYATVRGWLNEIKADHRNHYEFNQTHYSIKLLMPIPFSLAIQTVASAEGWPAEALAIAIGSNVGWLEHHGTRLKQKQNDDHSRGQNIPFFQGMDPSLRKTSLKTFTTQTCMQGANILPAIRDGSATCVDGTLKGHRNSILNRDRSGIETDEVTGAYHCSSGEASTQRGMHFAPREKILCFVNGERDAAMTADGTVTLAGYSFGHRVWGQIPAVTQVLIPKGVAGSLGFPKRFAVSFHQKCDSEPDQQCAASRKFLLDFHDWLGLHATPTKREPHLDNFALTMHFKTLQGTADFLAEDGAGPLFHQKIGFADTDLCRWSNVVMRMEQYLEELPAIRFAEGHTRLAMSVYNHAYANHYCHRQWQQHHALYVERDGASGAAGGGGGSGGGGDDGGGNAGSRLGGNAEFLVDEFVMKAIWENPRCNRQVSTSDVRIWLRNKLMHRGVKNVANVISAAVEKLVEAGVVTKADDKDPVPAEESTSSKGQPRGRRVILFKKEANFGNLSEGARELLSRLQVSADCFESP